MWSIVCVCISLRSVIVASFFSYWHHSIGSKCPPPPPPPSTHVDFELPIATEIPGCDGAARAAMHARTTRASWSATRRYPHYKAALHTRAVDRRILSLQNMLCRDSAAHTIKHVHSAPCIGGRATSLSGRA